MIWHYRFNEQLDHCSSILITLNKESLASIERNFGVLPPCPMYVADYFSDQGRALNLCGHAFLGQLSFSLSASPGETRLAGG